MRKEITLMSHTRIILTAAILLACLSACEYEPLPSADISSHLITNVMIIDGTGAARRKGAVRIDGTVIVKVGDLNAIPGESISDGNGLVLAPGFIDTHSHADKDLFDQPGATAAVGQGITTVVIGQDGKSPYPLLSFRFDLLADPAAVNVAAYAGHNTLRREAMGDDFQRHASPWEITVMKAMLEQELEAGALGLSTGLEYDPGIYSDTGEVISLAKVAAAQGGRYISHIRSEDRWFEQALDEIIEIGRVTGIPVQVSHIKLAMTSLWGRAPEFLEKMDAARAEGIDITADIYPYEYWQAVMMVLLPERNITDREEVEFILTDLAPAGGMWFTKFDPRPEFVGKTLAEIAGIMGTDPATAFMTLIAESEKMRKETGENADRIIGTSMQEEDVKVLLAWPHSNVCTDGFLNDLHPRGVGSFPRVLGRYVREQGLFSLEQAVHKMTGLSAQHMGFNNRGVIRAGGAADLVLFDPGKVIDQSTPEDPGALNTGISKVWVNGQIVFEDGHETGRRPGTFILRAKNDPDEI
jgi:N-acyl-D-amino-acid deacylase